MPVASTWLRQTRRTYFGNAAAQRDYRVQLRGNRSVILFGTYLTILIGVAYLRYSSIAGGGDISVVSAQEQLRDFYATIVVLLAGVVTVVTPALAATAIVSERQRRSLDLVFSAPVEPRYYLVGKAIAVYRYVWMLLILSLPVTAACVVVGGASWSDVLTLYGLLSIDGLLFAAIGLTISTLSSKPVSAVVWTYVAVALYLGGTWPLGEALHSAMRYGMASRSGQVPFLVGISPFTAQYAIGTFTHIWNFDVPNWILICLAMLLAVRLCLLGAGSLLSDGRETTNLRIHWLAVCWAIAFGLGYWISAGGYLGMLRSASRSVSPSPGDLATLVPGMASFWFFVPLLFVLPNLAAYGNDGPGRLRPNGWFSPKRIFDGTPAGSLPYLAVLIMGSSICAYLAMRIGGTTHPRLWFFGFAVFTLGFWSLFWAIGRLVSSYGSGIRSARTLVIVSMIVLVALPVPFLNVLAIDSFATPGPSLWDLYPLRPVLLATADTNMAKPLIYGAIYLAAALGLNFWADRRRPVQAVSHA